MIFSGSCKSPEEKAGTGSESAGSEMVNITTKDVSGDSESLKQKVGDSFISLQKLTEKEIEDEEVKIDYGLYLPVLQQHSEKYTDEIGTGYYTLHDLNGDGIRELFLLEGTCEADYIWKVFTIMDEETDCIGSFSGFHSVLYAGEDGVLYNVSCQMDTYNVWEIKLLEGTIIESLIWKEEKDVDNPSCEIERFKQNPLYIARIDD